MRKAVSCVCLMAMSVLAAGAARAGQQVKSAGAQPDLKAVKIDFVPGEKTLFYDDFSDMAPDEPPPHWKARGDAATLMIGKQVRELDLKTTQLRSPRFDLPADFTFQATAKFPASGDGNGRPATNWYFETAQGQPALSLYVNSDNNGQALHVTLDDIKNNTLGDTAIAGINFSQLLRLDLWVQNGRLRMYVNGNRVTDVNQVTLPPLVQISLHTRPGTGKEPVGLRKVRLAVSAPDFAKEILATGKYVTHGIHFDTNSAVLKPDSAPIIRQVADALIGDPNLKLEIDGYTDSIGNAQYNGKLSQQRAEAVLSVLVSQFGIDASRLTSNGFGAANPIGSNDTAAGRAENRRVEFIRKP